MSGDHLNDDVGISSANGSSNGSNQRKTGSQKAKPKKRKLRSIADECDEEMPAQGESSRSSSRSRCF